MPNLASEIQSAAEVAAVSGSVGAWIGHRLSRRRKAREIERDTIQSLVWAVGGKPATDFGPRVPGLVELVAALADKVEHHLIEGHTRGT